MRSFCIAAFLAAVLASSHCSPYCGPVGSSRISNGFNIGADIERIYSDYFPSVGDSIYGQSDNVEDIDINLPLSIGWCGKWEIYPIFWLPKSLPLGLNIGCFGKTNVAAIGNQQQMFRNINLSIIAGGDATGIMVFMLGAYSLCKAQMGLIAGTFGSPSLYSEWELRSFINLIASRSKFTDLSPSINDHLEEKIDFNTGIGVGWTPGIGKILSFSADAMYRIPMSYYYENKSIKIDTEGSRQTETTYTKNGRIFDYVHLRLTVALLPRRFYFSFPQCRHNKVPNLIFPRKIWIR